MRISARNQIKGKVLTITHGAINSEVIIEIAPGIDLQRDVLAQCAADVAVAADLREMDARIFRRGPMCANSASA